ncbi:MAG TPA: hypothetical protein VF173_06750 [Thermoanaerobaculia bacterium]|nr:hypothetical protein [Thermoanaerobaculia bacterium]
MSKAKMLKLVAPILLVALTTFAGAARSSQGDCDVLPCPELYEWSGCQCWCVCVSDECCQLYGHCSYGLCG